MSGISWQASPWPLESQPSLSQPGDNEKAVDIRKTSCFSHQKGKPPRIACCGHRGARKIAPENTLVSFQKAIEVGANCIELDVHLTRDGRLAVAHGRTVREKMVSTSDFNTTSLRVEDLEWSDLQKLDAGSWFSPNFKGLRVQSLEEVVDALWDSSIQLVVELKYEQCSSKGNSLVETRASHSLKGKEDQNPEENLKTVQRNCMETGLWERLYALTLVKWLIAYRRPEPWREPKLTVLFTSFNHLLVDDVAEVLAKNASNLGPLSDNLSGLAYIYGPNGNVTLAKRNSEVRWIALHDSLVQKIALEDRDKLPIISWVTDSLPLLERQVALGVHAVTTNDPTLCPSLCQGISG